VTGAGGEGADGFRENHQAIIRPRVPVPTGAIGFEQALAAARERRMQAREVVRRAMEEQEARTAAGAAAMDGEAWRLGHFPDAS
jgi:hypothetical protein